MQTLKEVMEGKYGVGNVPRYIFMNENRMINILSFGKHEKGIRDKRGIKDLALLCMNEASDNALLLAGHVDHRERKCVLEKVTQQFHKVAGTEPKSLPKQTTEQTSLASF